MIKVFNKSEKVIERYNPDINKGLSFDEVKKEKKINYQTKKKLKYLYLSLD